MRTVGLFLASLACLLRAVAAHGELVLTLALEHTTFLQFEAVNAFVSIYNDSDDTLILDESSAAGRFPLLFDIRRERDVSLSRTSKNPMIGRIRILPGEKRDVMVDISRWYDVAKRGRYMIQAVVTSEGRRYLSNTLMADVVRGMELARVTRELPGYEDRLRVFSLRYWCRDAAEYLFLCVDEPAAGMNYGVFTVGRLVRVAKPVLTADRHGTIVVQHQSGVDCYIRSVFKSTEEDVTFVDQTYHLADGSPYPQKRGREAGDASEKVPDVSVDER